VIATRYTGHLLHRSNPNLYPCYYAVIMRENNKLIAKVPMVDDIAARTRLTKLCIAKIFANCLLLRRADRYCSPGFDHFDPWFHSQDSIDTHTRGDPSRKLRIRELRYFSPENDSRDKFWSVLASASPVSN